MGVGMGMGIGYTYEGAVNQIRRGREEDWRAGLL
jgi:hypothetical protein